MQQKSTWGNPLQNLGCSLQLVKLIQYLKGLAGEPLAKLRFLSSLGLPKEDTSGKFDQVCVIQQYLKKSFK